MQKITYLQAAELLSVKYATIKNAVLHKKLTRCTSRTSEAMLLKEQVELFRNKRISEKALNLEDKALWDQYKEIAENPELISKIDHISATRDQVIDQMIKNAVDEGIKAGKDETINSLVDALTDKLIDRAIKRGIVIVNPQMPQVQIAMIS